MRIGIWGATGYGGAEALRMLCSRRDVEIAWVGSDSQAGRRVEEALPQFRNTAAGRLPFSPLRQAEVAGIDAALLALPHGQALSLAPHLVAHGVRVVDFSGDFRLPGEVYEQWYGRAHSAAPDLVQAVYGLPEVNREEIRGADLVANPGCHATCATLALLPLVEGGLIETSRIVVDAKSGVSGAGKAPQQGTHFVEVDESMRAYRVGAHQHTPEIEQTLEQAARRAGAAGAAPRILLTAQLLPLRRGIYVTAYAPLVHRATTEDLHGAFSERYATEPFVTVLDVGQTPELRHVAGTNQCHIGVHADGRTGMALVTAAIDNLGKGAAGQAIQNLNLMFGLDESAGLDGLPWV